MIQSAFDWAYCRTMIWSFLLPAIALVGLYLLNNKKKSGWALNAGAQVLWAYYGLSTSQPGFVVFAVFFFGMNVRGWLLWRLSPPVLNKDEPKVGLRDLFRPPARKDGGDAERGDAVPHGGDVPSPVPTKGAAPKHAGRCGTCGASVVGHP